MSQILIWLIFIHTPASVWTQGPEGRGLDLLLVQCQFSLGCGLTCTLDFLHQGAPHSSVSLILAAALSWALASLSHSLWSHAARLYPLHSTEHYCGKCITLLTSGHGILASLQRAVILAFALGTVASTTTVYDHFLSQKDALKFWTPLTLCYTMLVVYIQGDCQVNFLGNVNGALGRLLRKDKTFRSENKEEFGITKTHESVKSQQATNERTENEHVSAGH